MGDPAGERSLPALRLLPTALRAVPVEGVGLLPAGSVLLVVGGSDRVFLFLAVFLRAAPRIRFSTDLGRLFVVPFSHFQAFFRKDAPFVPPIAPGDPKNFRIYLERN